MDSVTLLDPRQQYDTSRATFERIFAPNLVPDGFVAGAHLVDLDAGLEATVMGCLPMPQNSAGAVLFLDIYCPAMGICPFVTDWVFLRRWRVLNTSKLLPEGREFTWSGSASEGEAPALGDCSASSSSSTSRSVIITPEMLHLTGFISPLPIDISCLVSVLGLRHGVLLTATEDSTGGGIDESCSGHGAAALRPPSSEGEAEAISSPDREAASDTFSFHSALDVLALEEASGNLQQGNVTTTSNNNNNNGSQNKKKTLATTDIKRGRDYFVVGLHCSDDFCVHLILRDAVNHNLVSPNVGSKFRVGPRFRESLLAIAAFKSRLPVVPQIPSPKKMTGLLYEQSIVPTPPHPAAAAAPASSPSSSVPADLSQLKKVDAYMFETVTKENLEAIERIRQRGLQRSTLQERHAAVTKLKDGLSLSSRREAEAVLDAVEKLVSEETVLHSWFPALRPVALGAPYKPGTTVPLIEAMLRDIYYQNIFVVRTTTGSPDIEARIGWEEKLSCGAYTRALEGSWRPRYGAANLTGAPGGRTIQDNRYGEVWVCFGGLRDWMSVSNVDSSVANSEVTGLRGPPGSRIAFLNRLPNDGLLELGRIVRSNVEYVPSKVDYQYSEVQVHARPQLARHVSHVVIPASFEEQRTPEALGRLWALMNFALKNACWLVTTSTLALVAEMRLWSEERLRDFLSAHGALMYLDAKLGYRMSADTNPTLVFGAASKRARELMDAIVDYFCVVEMSRLNGILYHAFRQQHQQQQQQRARHQF